MVKMNSQTKIIVFTAIALTAVDLSVRYCMLQKMSAPNVQGGVLTAREIRLVDGNGQLRAHLRTDENNEAGMVMYDRNGVNRLQLDTWDNVPSLILYQPNGMRSTYYGMDNDGLGSILMYGRNEQTVESIDTSRSFPSSVRILPGTALRQQDGQVYINGESNYTIETR